MMPATETTKVAIAASAKRRVDSGFMGMAAFLRVTEAASALHVALVAVACFNGKF